MGEGGEREAGRSTLETGERLDIHLEEIEELPYLEALGDFEWPRANNAKRIINRIRMSKKWSVEGQVFSAIGRLFFPPPRSAA